MKTKLKARVAAETLTDGSIVFNVMQGGEELATPASLQEAERIAADFNLRYFPTETRATPAPWFMQGNGKVGVQIVNDFGNIIAECPRFGVGMATAENPAPWHHAEANARLISAAPELLAACKLAREFDDNEVDWPTMRSTLNTAIAKAEGIVL